jgi:hypothetical protein
VADSWGCLQHVTTILFQSADLNNYIENQKPKSRKTFLFYPCLPISFISGKLQKVFSCISVFRYNGTSGILME